MPPDAASGTIYLMAQQVFSHLGPLQFIVSGLIVGLPISQGRCGQQQCQLATEMTSWMKKANLERLALDPHLLEIDGDHPAWDCERCQAELGLSRKSQIILRELRHRERNNLVRLIRRAIINGRRLKFLSQSSMWADTDEITLVEGNQVIYGYKIDDGNQPKFYADDDSDQNGPVSGKEKEASIL